MTSSRSSPTTRSSCKWRERSPRPPARSIGADELTRAWLRSVDCFAEWCGPCKRIAPDFAKMSDQDAGAKYIKVDVDDLEDFAAEYSIEAMPTFLVFKDGELFKRVVGANIAGVQEAINAAKA